MSSKTDYGREHAAHKATKRRLFKARAEIAEWKQAAFVVTDMNPPIPDHLTNWLDVVMKQIETLTRERDTARKQRDGLASRNEFERAAGIYALLKGQDTANPQISGPKPEEQKHE